MSMIAKLHHEVSRFHRRLMYSNCNTTTNSSSFVHKLLFHCCAAVKDIPINSRIHPNLATIHKNDCVVSGKRNDDGIVWIQYKYNKTQNQPIMTLQSFPMTTTTATTTATATNNETTNTFTNMTKQTRRTLVSNNNKFIPRKAAVALTDKARNLFKKLLENRENKDGILLKLQQSTTGQPRMVFTFGFAKLNEIGKQDEGVSLEVLEDGTTPKSPMDSMNDGLPKLYIHSSAFIKVLGATVDLEVTNDGNILLKLYDKEGNVIDPNA